MGEAGEGVRLGGWRWLSGSYGRRRGACHNSLKASANRQAHITTPPTANTTPLAHPETLVPPRPERAHELNSKT